MWRKREKQINRQNTHTSPTHVKYSRHNRRTWLVHSPTQRVGSGPLTWGASGIAIAPRLFTGPGRSHNLIMGAIRCHDRVLATTSSVIDDPTIASPFHGMCWGRSFVASSVRGHCARVTLLGGLCPW